MKQRWDQREQESSRDRRNRGRYSLHEAVEPIRCIPDCPDVHYMGGSAGQDESTKREKAPVELQILPLASAQEHENWDREVGCSDDCVGNYVQPNDSGVPEITHAVRHEITGEQFSEEFKHSDSESSVGQGSFLPAALALVANRDQAHAPVQSSTHCSPVGESQ